MDRGGARAFPLPRPPGVDAGFDDDGPGPALAAAFLYGEQRGIPKRRSSKTRKIKNVGAGRWWVLFIVLLVTFCGSMTFVNGTGRPSYSLCAMKSVVRRARMWYDESVTGKYPCFYADVN